MVRIQPVNAAAATGHAGALLGAVKAKIGVVPNIFATFAQSPKVLEGYLGFSTALSQGRLSPKLREQIALTVAGINSCDYCASAHTALGKVTGLDAEELARNLRGESRDPETQVVLDFVREVVDRHGVVADGELDALRHAGYDDGEVVEIVAHIAVNIFTNYFNHIAGTEIDFPVVRTAGVTLAA